MPTNAIDSPRKTHNDSRAVDQEPKVGHEDLTPGPLSLVESPAEIDTAPSKDQRDDARDAMAERNDTTGGDPLDVGWTAQSGVPFLGNDLIPEPRFEEHELPAHPSWAAMVDPALVIGSDEAQALVDAREANRQAVRDAREQDDDDKPSRRQPARKGRSKKAEPGASSDPGTSPEA